MAKRLGKMAAAERTAEVSHIRDLVPDAENRRKHNPRNIGMVVDSLHTVGAARSIVIDENNVILAGNGVSEAAAEAGITRVQVVDADGSTLVAVRRTGLSPEQKRALALYDNRTGELAEWNAEQLRVDARMGLELDRFWTEDELSKLLKLSPENGDETVLDQAVQLKPAREYIVVMCADGSEGATQFERLRTVLSLGLVRRGGYRHGSPFDATGVERVVTAERLLEQLKAD